MVIYPPTSEHGRLAEGEDAGHAAPAGTDSGDLCEILEKPASKEDQIRNLMNMAGKDCEIVTGVAISMFLARVRKSDVHALALCLQKSDLQSIPPLNIPVTRSSESS